MKVYSQAEIIYLRYDSFMTTNHQGRVEVKILVYQLLASKRNGIATYFLIESKIVEEMC